MEPPQEQSQSTRRNPAEHLQPWQFKKGQSGNPGGRKPGTSLKEYARNMIACMTDEEKMAYLHGLPKEVIWKMVEGNPDTRTDVTTKGEPIKSDVDLEALAALMSAKLKEEKI